MTSLPLALRVIGTPEGPARCARPSASCRRGGARARTASTATATAPTSTPTRSGSWTPGGRGCVRAEFQPGHGQGGCSTRLEATYQIDNAPNNHGDHLGSAYQDGWYGYVRKDLRSACCDRTVKRPLRRAYCGARQAARLPGALRASLQGALAVPASALYGDDAGLRGRGQGRRPAVLGRGALPPARRRHPAADPVDQPAHLPAGQRDPDDACPE